MDPKIGKLPETEPSDSKHQVGKSKEENGEKGNSKNGDLEKNHTNTKADIEMEAEITPEDVEKAGGFGARDDIGSLLPATIDATDLEESLRDARGFEEEGGGDDKVISLYRSRGIQSLRLFNPDQNALHALKESGISAILGTLNQDLQQLASSQSYAATWVQTNVAPFAGSVHFKYIDAGNEVIPGDLAAYVLPAMQNLDAALKDAGYSIPVTTAVSTQVS